MADVPSHLSGSRGNPLESDDPAVWDRLVEGLHPPAMLACIQYRMSATLLAALSPEDIWQETLLHVWRDRGRCAWRGPSAFRRWVLSVVDHRIRDAADRVGAQKRGGGRLPQPLDASRGGGPPPVVSTTPSRVASDLESGRLMRRALDGLPDDVREVVRLRLFEERSVEEVAEALSLGVSAVKHRFRKGAAAYQRRLQQLLDASRV